MKHEITLTELAETGYQIALETGEDPMEKKLNLHYEGLAPMAEKRAKEAAVATYLKVKDSPAVQAAIAAEVAKTVGDPQKPI